MNDPTRARLGLVVPPNNTVNEAEWQGALPAGVSLHAMRFRLDPTARTREAVTKLTQGLVEACGVLAEAPVSVIAFGCTAPSAVSPRRGMEDAMRLAAGVPAVTAAAAVVDALQALGARRVALLSPFGPAITSHEADFLKAEGIEVVETRSLGHATYAPGRRLEIHLIPPADVVREAMALPVRDVDALVLSGTNLVTFPAIEQLEAESGLPVVSSNQATLWASLRKAGVRDRLPLGRLFDRPHPETGDA